MAETRRARIEGIAARAVRRILPRTPDFAPLLAEQVDLVHDVLDVLARYLETGDPSLPHRVSALEKVADRCRERNLATLHQAFSTGFDRDLTATAILRIDDIANDAKTTAKEMEVLDLRADDTMREITAELVDGVAAMRRAAVMLSHDPDAVAAEVRAVHKHERTVDKRYRAAVAALLPADPALIMGSGPDAVPDALAHLLDAMRRREVYRHLANAADRMDEGGRVLGEIAVSAV